MYPFFCTLYEFNGLCPTARWGCDCYVCAGIQAAKPHKPVGSSSSCTSGERVEIMSNRVESCRNRGDPCRAWAHQYNMINRYCYIWNFYARTRLDIASSRVGR